jgi:2'-5' RNA ligase
VNLRAAFVPPAATVGALAELLRHLEPPASTGEARRGLFSRRPPEAAPAAGPLLEVMDPEGMLLPITDFGNVASGDARRLGDALERLCADLPSRPTVRLGGGAALLDPGDRCVWANLTGADDDLAAMRAVASAVVAGVEPLGYFRDRRQFKPRLAIATITDDTTVEHLEQVLAALDAYESEPWEVREVALLQRGAGPWRTLPIGD